MSVRLFAKWFPTLSFLSSFTPEWFLLSKGAFGRFTELSNLALDFKGIRALAFHGTNDFSGLVLLDDDESLSESLSLELPNFRRSLEKYDCLFLPSFLDFNEYSFLFFNRLSNWIFFLSHALLDSDESEEFSMLSSSPYLFLGPRNAESFSLRPP